MRDFALTENLVGRKAMIFSATDDVWPKGVQAKVHHMETHTDCLGIRWFYTILDGSIVFIHLYELVKI